jgi:hypothetical protein
MPTSGLKYEFQLKKLQFYCYPQRINVQIKASVASVVLIILWCIQTAKMNQIVRK